MREPGFAFTVRDGNLTAVPSMPITERLLIIGMALDGPINTPVYVRSLADAQRVFGPMRFIHGYKDPQTGTASGRWSGNTLMDAYFEAFMGGASNVFLVRATGTFATATPGGTPPPIVTPTPAFAGSIYNDMVITATPGTGSSSNSIVVTITPPGIKGEEFSLTFNRSTTTFRELCETVNKDVRNSCVIFSVPEASGSLLLSAAWPATGTGVSWSFSGGKNDTIAPGDTHYADRSGVYTALTHESTGTFNVVRDFAFNVCVLAGIYGDDKVADENTVSVADAFAQYIHDVSSEIGPCHGVLGLNPFLTVSPPQIRSIINSDYLSTVAGVSSRHDKIIKFGYFMNRGFTAVDEKTNQRVDAGRYLSIVAGPDVVIPSTERGLYRTNGAAVYAGRLTTLPPQQAVTNKVLSPTVKLAFMIPHALRRQLISGVGYNETVLDSGGGAYVIFKANDLNAAPVTVLDNTAAMRASDYRALQIMRIVNFAAQEAKAVLQPYIGQPSSAEVYAAIKTQLDTALQRMVEAGMLIGGGGGYDFAITSNPLDRTYSQITVTLKLRPSLQIREILVDVTVSQ